jgi:hypothetical protein
MEIDQLRRAHLAAVAANPCCVGAALLIANHRSSKVESSFSWKVSIPAPWKALPTALE